MIINRSTLGAFFTGLQARFNGALGQTETYWPAYGMEVPSTTSAEQYAWMALIPGFREWLGDRVLNNIRTYDYTIKNKPWENSLSVKRDDLEDDKIGLYGPMAAALGMEAARHPQELMDALLINGFTSLCYDGQPFFSTSHPTYGADGSITLVSNNGGGAGNAWFLIDDTRAIKPLLLQKRKAVEFVSMTNLEDERVFMAKEFRFGADWRGNVGYGLWQLAYGSKQTLDGTNYQAARAAMMSMSGDNGRKLGLTPKLLVCGPSNEDKAKTLLLTDRTTGGADNIYKGTAKLVVSPYLT